MCNLFAHDEDKDPTENYAKCLLGCDIQSKYNQTLQEKHEIVDHEERQLSEGFGFQQKNRTFY